MRCGVQIRRQELIVLTVPGAATGDHLAKYIHTRADAGIEDTIEMIEAHVLGSIHTEAGYADLLERLQIGALLPHHPCVADQIRQAWVAATAANAVSAHLIGVSVVADALRRAEIAGAQEVGLQRAEQA
ncbi:hypothetical protein XBLMG947_0129 [Xanthomonas bromi]|uniref:Uncharacterized protein n=1 Tax=Xanthomonas bromi TaxID=56449 RepID=A0A1C3NG90_9XANT|nr:hypothetical protein XBLMG947_0129 [Xanthomonas bromi]